MPGSIFDFTDFIAERTADFVGREWVFEAVDTWLADPEAPNFFIITGGPGTGKSAVAARLTQRYDLAAYHFCMARDAETINPYPFARSLSQQLAQMPAFADRLTAESQGGHHIEQKVGINYGEVTGIKIERLENLVINAPSAAVAFSQAVTQPLRALPAGEDGKQLLILVDALDEAVRHQGAESIVELLANVGRLPAHVRFVLTSRPEGAALEPFEQLRVPYSHLDAQREENQDDIGAFVRRRLAEEERLAKRLAGTPWQREQFADRVAERSQGNFLYAEYLLRAVASGESLLRDDDTLPEGLDGVYREFLRTRLPSPKSTAWRSELRSLLGVLAAAKTPLTTAQIGAFSGLERQTIWDLLGDIEQFLDPRRYADDLFQFYHQSLPDFLTDEDKAGRYWIDLQPVHERILNSYRPADGDWDGVAWAAIDAYGLAYLPAHLHEAGWPDEVEALLFSFERMAARLHQAGVRALIDDYVLRGSQSRQTPLGLVQGALQLAVRALEADAGQLSGQLLGRLGDFDDAHIRHLLDRAREGAAHSWLEPLMGRLTAPGGAELFRLEGHGKRANVVAITPDGRQAVSGSYDRTVRIWDLATGEAVAVLEEHRDVLEALAITPDGRLVISASRDATLRIWDLASQTQIAVLEGHAGYVNAVAITPDGQRAVSASADGTLRIWELEPARQLAVLEGHTSGVNAVAITPDGRHALSASSDWTLRLWDLAGGQALAVLEGHTSWVNTVVISTDGQRAVSASADGTLRIWDLARAQVGPVLRGHDYEVNAVAITPDGRRAVSAAADDTLRIWDLETGQTERILKAHNDQVTAVAISPDGRQVVSGSWDHTLRVWDLATGAALATFEGHSFWVSAVAITPDGQRVISASWEGPLRVWDLATGQRDFVTGGHEGTVIALAITPDGQRAVSASFDWTLRVWDLHDRRLERVLTGHSDQIHGLAVTPDGRRVVSASVDRTLRVWDLATGGQEAVLEGGGSWMNEVAITPDGRWLVACTAEKSIAVWNMVTGQAGPHLAGHSAEVLAAAITPDGRRVVSASADGTLRVWDLVTGEAERVLAGHDDRVADVRVLPDGRRAISASWDRSLRVWDLATGATEMTLTGHEAGVIAVKVAADGQRAVSASWDGPLRVWNLATGVEAGTLVGHRERVNGLDITPDGRLAVSASEDHTIRVWDLTSLAETARFYLDYEATVAVCVDNGHFLVGDDGGNVSLFRLVGGER